MRSSRSGQIRSPSRREALNQQLTEHTQRVRDLMLADITILEEENNLLKMKCLKVEELEEKVELVLRNNEQLFSENQKLARLVEDKITECELLRTRRNYDSGTDKEKNRLLIELEELRRQISEVQHMKNLTIKQIRNKHQIELETMIADHQTELKIYDKQLMKIRDDLQSKDKALSIANNKLKDQQSEFNAVGKNSKEKSLKEIGEKEKIIEELTKSEKKLKEDIEKFQSNEKKLKSQNQEKQTKNQELIKIERKLKQEIEDLNEEKRKNSKNLQQKIETLENENKKLEQKHQNMVNQLQKELKTLQEKHEEVVGELEEKIADIGKESTTHNMKNQDLKQEIHRARKEIEGLKTQIRELNILNEQQITTLKNKLEELHEGEINEITANHQTHKNYLERQLLGLQDQLKAKQIDYNLLMEDKLVMKDRFIEEGKQIKEDFKMLQYEFKLSQDKSRDEIKKLNQELIDGQIKNRELKDELEQKFKQLKNQYELRYCELREEFQKKNKEMGQTFRNISELKLTIKNLQKQKEQSEIRFKENINGWKESFFNSKAELEKSREEWESSKSKFIKEKQQIVNKYEELIKNNKVEYEKLERQNESLKDFIGSRDKGIDQLIDKITALTKLIDEKDSTIDDLRQQLIESSKKYTDRMSEQKGNMDKNYRDKIRYVTEDFQTRNTILETNLDIALKELKAKQSQLEELIRQYQLMRSQMILLTEQEANKKQLTLKYAGATADLIATKNMFDVFVKEKVLQTCSEALVEKQNKPTKP